MDRIRITLKIVFLILSFMLILIYYKIFNCQELCHFLSLEFIMENLHQKTTDAKDDNKTANDCAPGNVVEDKEDADEDSAGDNYSNTDKDDTNNHLDPCDHQ